MGATIGRAIFASILGVATMGPAGLLLGLMAAAMPAKDDPAIDPRYRGRAGRRLRKLDQKLQEKETQAQIAAAEVRLAEGRPVDRQQQMSAIMATMKQELAMVDRISLPDDEKQIVRDRIEAKYLQQISQLFD